MRVIVVGAGMGGLLLAQGLRREGIDVVVYERDWPRGRPQGVSLHLDDRGWMALRGCLPAGHLAMVEATAGRPRHGTRHVGEVDGELAVVPSPPPIGVAATARAGRPVDRRLLRAVLLTGLADAVRFGAGFTRYEQGANGPVRAWFADGATEAADVLVGADGIGSAVRRQHLPQVQVVDTGRRMVMGATPLRAVAGTGLPGLIGDQATAAQARGAAMVLAALRYTQPPAEAREAWLPALPAHDVAGLEDYLMWTVPTTADRLGPADAPEAAWQRARDLVVHQHPTLRLVVDAGWAEVTVALRVGMVPPVAPWPPGPVTLLGDAVHAAPGFGATLALQDALRLRDALVRADRGQQGLAAAIGEHEDLMRREGLAALDAFRGAA